MVFILNLPCASVSSQTSVAEAVFTTLGLLQRYQPLPLEHVLTRRSGAVTGHKRTTQDKHVGKWQAEHQTFADDTGFTRTSMATLESQFLPEVLLTSRQRSLLTLIYQN